MIRVQRLSRAELSVVRLMGERDFPVIEVGRARVVVSPEQLPVPADTIKLLADWIRFGRDDDSADGDLITLRGLEAGAALARELNFEVRVNYSTRQPATGDWLSVEFVQPGNRD